MEPCMQMPSRVEQLRQSVSKGSSLQYNLGGKALKNVNFNTSSAGRIPGLTSQLQERSQRHKHHATTQGVGAWGLGMCRAPRPFFEHL